MVQRITLEPVEFGSELIPSGRIVIPVIGAANRDPSVFEKADELDIRRTPNPHLSFGGGAHFCIGAPLARLEGRIILGTLLRRFPDLRLVKGAVARRPTFVVRGLTRLEVTWR